MSADPARGKAANAAAPGFDPSAFDACVMGTYRRLPVALERGEGCRLWDTQGNEYLDFVAGVATCALGHAHPALVAAVTQQVQHLHHASNLYYTPLQGQLAQWLVERSCADRAFFCNSGAEANEAAIKLARKHARAARGITEPLILSARASFHGRTLATMAATGQAKVRQGFEPLPPGFAQVPYNDSEALEAALTPQVAAIMLEPLQGEGGVRPGDPSYFQRVRQLCDERGILLIMDEVQTGMGRTGTLWGYQQLGIEPDAITSAKGLAGGIPMGAMLCKRFCDAFEPGDHASTFGGNPLACAAALAVGQTLERDGLPANARARGEQLRSRLTALARQFPQLFEGVRGWGVISGLVLRADARLEALDIVKAALQQGLLVAAAGAGVVRLVPPLIVSAYEVERGADALERAVGQLAH